MESFLNYTIDQFVVESHDGRSSTDLTRCVSSIKYYEDLFSPAIFITLVLVNTDGLLSSLINLDSNKQSGIKGGERVRLKINQPAFPNNAINIQENKNTYYIYKTSLSTTEYTREALVIDLCPAEVFINETSRIFKKCSDHIGNTVDQILKESFGKGSYKKENIEQTLNKYVFYGNNKRPFTVITWLCPKSIPLGKSTPTSASPNKGTAGFLFYQNRDGFNFKSIDSLMSGLKLGTANKRNIQTYYYATPPNPASDIQNRLIVDIPTFEKNVNVMENLRIGMYSSINYFFDVNARKFYAEPYSLKESYELMSHASRANVPPPVPLGLDKNPSRVMVRILDNFNSDPAGLSPEAAINNKDNSNLYQAASIARYNLAFSQSLNITIPLNLSLSVGDIINLQFPKITTGNRGEKDDIKSGHYLIKEIAHLFETNQGYTGLKLIRDSYGGPE
jgi:hypothetical protein